MNHKSSQLQYVLLIFISPNNLHWHICLLFIHKNPLPYDYVSPSSLFLDVLSQIFKLGETHFESYIEWSCLMIFVTKASSYIYPSLSTNYTLTFLRIPSYISICNEILHACVTAEGNSKCTHSNHRVGTWVRKPNTVANWGHGALASSRSKRASGRLCPTRGSDIRIRRGNKFRWISQDTNILASVWQLINKQSFFVPKVGIISSRSSLLPWDKDTSRSSKSIHG